MILKRPVIQGRILKNSICKVGAILGLIIGTMTQAHAVQLTQNFADLAQTENSIFVTHATKSKGAVLVVHGLNLKPSKMNALSEFFYISGYDVYRLTLSGHDGDMTAFKEVTSEKWLSEVVEAESTIHQRMVESGSTGPTLLMGYSLGAVASLAAFNSGLTKFDRLILIAPPLFTTRTAALVKNLFGFPGMMLPSKNNADYRVHSKTPVSAYIALFDLMEWVNAPPSAPLAESKGLVFLSPQDELVDTTKVSSYITEQFPDWKIHPLSKENATLKPVSHHLMIDEPSLGPKPFAELLETIKAFIAPQ